MKTMDTEKFAMLLQAYVKEKFFPEMSAIEFSVHLAKEMAGFAMKKSGSTDEQIKQSEDLFDALEKDNLMKEAEKKLSDKKIEVIKQGDDLEMLDESGFTQFAEESLKALDKMGFATCIVAGYRKGKDGDKDHLMMGSTGHGLGFKVAGERLLELEKSLRKSNQGIWG